MAKGKETAFFCQNCGYESAKWMGQCPACHEWNTFVEEPAAQVASTSSSGTKKPTSGVVKWETLGDRTGKTGAFSLRSGKPAAIPQGGTKGEAGMSVKFGGQSGSRASMSEEMGDRVSMSGAASGFGSRKEPLSASARRASRSKALPLSRITASDAERVSSGIGEMDRVLGGGIVPGSLVLVGGDPGIGKSTLLLQMCRNLADEKQMGGLPARVLYVSGEESQQQIKLRANRMGDFSDSLLVMCETNLSDIQEAIAVLEPQVVIIDSIQTMYSETVSSAPGSVSQVREATGVLMQLAKGLGVTIFIIGHVTKEGAVAGPRVLEHMVDTVLYFEGDRHASYRILHAVKNRFGSTDEIGVFEMKENGLREVLNPSEFMLEGRPEGASGSVVACSIEGTRPILIEVQALTAPSNLAYPRRTVDGADLNRVNLLLAVLERRLGLSLSQADVYVNIAGGVRMKEPAIDLGIIIAVISSCKDIVIDPRTLVFGEVGLSGEIRSVSQAPLRVREAEKLGFSTVILPQACVRSVGRTEGIRLIGVRTVRDVVTAVSGRGY